MPTPLEHVQRMIETMFARDGKIPSQCVKFSLSFTHGYESVSPAILKKSYNVAMIPRLADHIAASHEQTANVAILYPRDPAFEQLFRNICNETIPQPQSMWIVCLGVPDGHIIGCLPDETGGWEIIDTAYPSDYFEIETMHATGLRRRIATYHGVGKPLQMIRFYAKPPESY